MTDSQTAPNLSPRQRHLAAATEEAARSARAAAEARRGQPPVPGDRYVLAATAGFPVEWVLLERHRELPAFLAAPADVHPLVGSADLPLPDSALRLRGGAAAWIAESALAPASRVGAVDRVTVERARRKLQDSVQETDPDLVGEVDASPEYRDWRREVVAPALTAMVLQGLAAEGSVPAAPGRPETRPETEALPRAGRPRRWAAAAAVFCASTVGLAGYAGWQQERLGDLAAANRLVQEERLALRQERQEMAAALESERVRLSQAASRTGVDWQRRLDEQRRADEARRVDLERRLAALEAGQTRQAALSRAVLNVPLALLNPAEMLRSSSGMEPDEVHVWDGAPDVTVGLNLDSEEKYDSYRVVLKQQGSEKVVWQSGGLQRQDYRVTLSLDPRLLPAGVYRFDLAGLRGGREEPLGEYGMRVLR
jgi:hypothetical protein